MKSPPNILFITTDQQRWDYLSLYGTPGLVTPVLDNLASEGLCFENTYCTTPLCIPSRVSLMSLPASLWSPSQP